jgi:hypothetical protein
VQCSITSSENWSMLMLSLVISSNVSQRPSGSTWLKMHAGVRPKSQLRMIRTALDGIDLAAVDGVVVLGVDELALDHEAVLARRCRSSSTPSDLPVARLV